MMKPMGTSIDVSGHWVFTQRSRATPRQPPSCRVVRREAAGGSTSSDGWLVPVPARCYRSRAPSAANVEHQASAHTLVTVRTKPWLQMRDGCRASIRSDQRSFIVLGMHADRSAIGTGKRSLYFFARGHWRRASTSSFERPGRPSNLVLRGRCTLAVRRLRQLRATPHVYLGMSYAWYFHFPADRFGGGWFDYSCSARWETTSHISE